MSTTTTIIVNRCSAAETHLALTHTLILTHAHTRCVPGAAVTPAGRLAASHLHEDIKAHL